MAEYGDERDYRLSKRPSGWNYGRLPSEKRAQRRQALWSDTSSALSMVGSSVGNPTELVLVSEVYGNLTRADMPLKAVSLPIAVPPEVQIGFGPFGGGKKKMLTWMAGFAGLSWVLERLGLPTPVKDLLEMTGETLGLPDVFGRFSDFFGDAEVAVYYKGRLLGRMELEGWKAFKDSMRRSVKMAFRVE